LHIKLYVILFECVLAGRLRFHNLYKSKITQLMNSNILLNAAFGATKLISFIIYITPFSLHVNKICSTSVSLLTTDNLYKIFTYKY